MNTAEHFREAILAAGLNPPDVIEPGKFHRFPGEGKGRHNEAGWCKLFDDGMGGVFGDYSSGLSADWHAKREKPFSQAERDAFKRQIAEAKQQADVDQAKRKAEAAEKASNIWKDAQPALENHPYLIRKHVQPHGVRMDAAGCLAVPMYADGTIQSLQFIAEDGTKRFLPGGRVMGCYYPIGKPEGVLCIAEGFATGASIREATGYPVAVAFNAGNLEPAARALRAKFTDLRIVICADDDAATAGNPGLTKATEAARAVGGLLAVPDFGTDRPDGATDFNDMVALMGPEAVREAVARASVPGKAPDQATEETLASGNSAPPDLSENTPISDDSEPATISDDERIERLAQLSPIEYDRVREKEAKALGVRSSTLDKMTRDRRKDQADTDSIDFDEVDRWPHPVDGAELLTNLSATIQRFIICPEETAHAAALWIVMSWFMDVVQVAPLAVITAPEKRCGKSQLLFVLGRLVHRPLAASNITPAALFRAVDAWKPTLLVDEADAFMKDNEELRGLLNCGHTRDSAYIVRVVGDDHTPKRFNVWGAKALAGIGHLADTIMDRAITLELRRKLPTENVMRLRHVEPGLFDDLASKLARFAHDNREALRRCRPDLPAQLHDRAQDNWEPLLAIAEISKGRWPELARHAALKLSGQHEEGGTVGNELLADIREIFETKRIVKISTADLITELCNDDEKSWATYNRGKPISPRQIAKKLKDYGIASKTVRIGYETPKGFESDQFQEAFTRYLASSSATSETAPQPSNGNDYSVADHTPRCGNKNESATLEPLKKLGCGAVADKNPEIPEMRVTHLPNGQIEVEL